MFKAAGDNADNLLDIQGIADFILNFFENRDLVKSLSFQIFPLLIFPADSSLSDE